MLTMLVIMQPAGKSNGLAFTLNNTKQYMKVYSQSNLKKHILDNTKSITTNNTLERSLEYILETILSNMKEHS